MPDYISRDYEDLIYEFNNLPANYLHDSWWLELNNGGVLKLLSGNKRVEKKLSEIIIVYFKLDVDIQCQFDNYISNIALLSFQEITDFSYNLGLLYAGHQVNKVIIKSKLKDYNELIGDDKYFFVRNTAPSMRESLGISAVSFLPEVRFEQFPTHMHRVGMNLISKALSREDLMYKMKLILKLGVKSRKYLNNKSNNDLNDSNINSSEKIVEALMRHYGFKFENIK